MMTTLAPLLRTVSLADTEPQPWKNGGGSTRELLAWPRPDAWQWRISVADISRAGPFSAFPGVLRGFAVLQGTGVVLQVHGQALRLTPDSDPLHFDGAAPPGCKLIDGPTLDLNVMTLQDAGQGQMQRARVGQPWHSRAPLRALLSLQPARLSIDDGPARDLPAGTLAWSDQADEQQWLWQPQAAGARAWWLAYTPHKR